MIRSFPIRAATVRERLATGLAEFEVQAGVPSENAGTLAFDPGGVTIGSGSLQIKSDVISVVLADAGENKTAVQQQAVVCLDACSAAGIDQTVCQSVCDNMELEITVWVAVPEDKRFVRAAQETRMAPTL